MYTFSVERSLILVWTHTHTHTYIYIYIYIYGQFLGLKSDIMDYFTMTKLLLMCSCICLSLSVCVWCLFQPIILNLMFSSDSKYTFVQWIMLYIIYNIYASDRSQFEVPSFVDILYTSEIKYDTLNVFYLEYISLCWRHRGNLSSDRNVTVIQR